MHNLHRPDRLLRREEASRYLLQKWGISRTASTLAKLAVVGGGPCYRKDGRFPLYAIEDLDHWVRTQLSQPITSTAELAMLMRELKNG